MVSSSTSSSETIPLNGFTPAQFLVIAVEIIQELGWEVDYLSDAGLIAFAGQESTDKKIRLTLKINRFTAKMSSLCTDPENQNIIEGQKAILEFMLSLFSARHTHPAGELKKRYEALQPSFSPPDKSKLHYDSSSFDEALGEFISLFTPREGYFITPLLLGINTAFFIVALITAQLFKLDSHYIISLGANSRTPTLNGEPWRLLSNVFLHWDIVHLFTNMLALYFIGSALEPYLKKGRFAVVYLLLGVLASVTSLWWHVKAVSAGASGAIFGLYGIFLALLTTNLLEPAQRKSLLPGMILFIGYNLLGGTRENIDSAAHIGGFIGGVIVGFFLYPGLKSRRTNAGEPQ